MKIIAIIMIIATMAVSCSSVEDLTCKYPSVNHLENTGCKTHESEIADFDASESDSDFEHGTIQIWCGDIPMKMICRFNSLQYPCDFGKVNIQVSYTDKTLTIVEFPSSDQADCLCEVDASFVIENLPDEDFMIKVYHGDTFGNYNANKPNFVGDTKSIASGEKLEYSYR